MQRLAGMDEGVLAALLNAASQAQTTQLGAATVSAPAGAPPKPAGPHARIEESEAEDESDGDTEEGGEAGAGTPGKKAMKAMKAMKGGGAKKAVQAAKKSDISRDNLPKGWKVIHVPRPSKPEAKDKNWVAPSGERFDRWAKVVQFLSD